MDSDFKPRLLEEMEKYFGEDSRRIAHARRVTEFAEQIMAEEEGTAPVVVLAASALHDIGIPEAEKKYGSAAGTYHEQEGPPVARRILEKLEVGEKVIEEACAIIANHHHLGNIDTPNFRVVYDADWVVNLKHDYDTQHPQKLAQAIEKVFLTRGGKAMARRRYLGQ